MNHAWPEGQELMIGRIAVNCWVGWWACQDLNLGPHPYQAYSRDAFNLVEPGTASSSVGWQ
jgi:hypothetical protein